MRRSSPSSRSTIRPRRRSSAIAGAGRADSELVFELLEDLTDVQLVERYDPQGQNQLRATPFGRIAHARVTGAAA